VESEPPDSLGSDVGWLPLLKLVCSMLSLFPVQSDALLPSTLVEEMALEPGDNCCMFNIGKQYHMCRYA